MIEVELPDGRVVEFPQGTAPDVMRAALRKLTTRQPNTNPGVSSDAPPDMVLNPGTGQYTSRELLANADQPTRATAAGRGAARGVTFGGIDELSAGLNAAIPGAGTAGERYTFGRERARAAEDAAMRDFPITASLSEIGGAAAPALTYGLPAMAGRGAMGAIGAGGIVGGIEGLLYGALSGEGGLRDRAGNAGQYGLLGATVGATAPALISAMGRGARGIMDAFSGGAESVVGAGSQSRAGRALVSTANRAGMTADDVDAALIAAQREGQPEFRVADALGVSGQRRLSGLARAGGDASAEITDFLNARQLDQGDRLGGFVADAFTGMPNPGNLPVVPGSTQALLAGRGTAQATEAALTKARDDAADQAFSAVRNTSAPVDVRGVLSVLDSKIQPFKSAGIADEATSALEKLRAQLAGQSSQGATELSDFNKVFQIRRRLRDRINTLYQQGESEVARDLKAVKSAMDDALEGASDDYRRVMNEYRQSSRVIEAVDTGRGMIQPGQRADDTTAAFARMTPEQQAAARVGYGDRVLSRMEATAGEGTNRARPLTSTKAQREIGAIANDPDLLMSRLGRENTMFETRARALGGSRTADNMEDIADLRPYDMGLLANIATGRFSAAGQQVTQAAGDLMTGMNPRTRQILGEAMMAQDAGSLRDALAKAQTVTERRQVLDALARITAQRTEGAGLLE